MVVSGKATKTCVERLRLPGCTDERLLERVERLRRSRREVVHEKAQLEFADEGRVEDSVWIGQLKGEIGVSQDEAENARVIMVGVRYRCQVTFRTGIAYRAAFGNGRCRARDQLPGVRVNWS